MSSTVALTSTDRPNTTRLSRSFSLRNTFRGGAKLSVSRPKTSDSRQNGGVDALRDPRAEFEEAPQLPPLPASFGDAKTNLKSGIFATPTRVLVKRQPQDDRVSPLPSSTAAGTPTKGASGKKSEGLKARAERTFSFSRRSRPPPPARVELERSGQPPTPTSTTTDASPTLDKPTKVLGSVASCATVDGLQNTSTSRSNEPATPTDPVPSDGKFSKSTSSAQYPAGTSGSSSPSNSIDGRSSKDGDNNSTPPSSVASSRGSSLTGKQDNKSENSSSTRPGDAPRKPRRGLSVFTRSAGSETSIARTDSSGTMSDASSGAGMSAASFRKVKDEMWGPFKQLDNDYSKYQSKSNNAQKTQIVKQCLLPFLRRYHGVPPGEGIAPEELERRTKILNKWWTGMVAHLRCRTTQAAVTGADKPAYLESISYIISRPEWRMAPSTFAPLAERESGVVQSASSSSLASTSSSYSIEKHITHIIKTTYWTSLNDTLAYVVERLGFRTAPPSLVAFGGKVLAYAFFFSPAVADMLISLWRLPADTLRRVPPQFGVRRGFNMQGISASLMDFPETLDLLKFSTVTELVRQMRKPKIPPIAVPIDWHGPWLSRWCGRDSDLLYVFFKQYHILLCEFLPFNPTPTMRLCAPGYVPVLAQLLSLIDDTIHARQTQQNAEPIASTTFEDLLNANAPLPLPTRNNNNTRTMAENKLIVLLKDVLGDNIITATVRDTFVHSFAAMLKAAVERTQMHDADACFQICDIMEELVPAFTKAAKEGKGDFIDWPFWLKVVKLMFQSVSNTTELRIISLVYSMYDTLCEDEDRKRAVVLDWLLSEPIWERFFCHWCPMARAYFMRLVCWRIGRFNGEASELDTEIYKTLLLRLRTGFVYHTKLRESGRFSSTAPCLPAPSRRLVILRNDVLSAPPGVLLDGLVPPSFASPAISRNNSSTSLASLAEVPPQLDSSASSPVASSPVTPTSTVSRGWAAIRSAFSFKTDTVPEDLDPSKTPTPPSSRPLSVASDISYAEPQMIKVANFKFSLENLERPVIGRQQQLHPPRLAMSTQLYLENVAGGVADIKGMFNPGKIRETHWTYIGRALSEWGMVVKEYDGFFERRMMEGRESVRDVETPALTVEAIRKG